MLSESDAHLMALRQSVTQGRRRVADCIDALEDALIEDDPHKRQDQIMNTILSLKYVTDFILGEPKP